MFYPLQLPVLKCEGGSLAERNMQVGGEPAQQQIILNHWYGSCSLQLIKGHLWMGDGIFHCAKT